MLPELNGFTYFQQAFEKRGKASVISILSELPHIDLQAWPPAFLANL